MVAINRRVQVPHQAADMFALVNDIEEYPNFLPWCNAATVLEKNADEIKATLTLALGKIAQSFTTINRLQEHKIIEMRLVDGPFKHLEGFWRFEALEEGGCQVSLDLEYEFINKILGFMIGPVFNKIANSLIDAFCERAAEIYAK